MPRACLSGFNRKLTPTFREDRLLTTAFARLDPTDAQGQRKQAFW